MANTREILYNSFVFGNFDLYTFRLNIIFYAENDCCRSDQIMLTTNFIVICLPITVKKSKLVVTYRTYISIVRRKK